MSFPQETINRKADQKISIIVPCFNESKVIKETHNRLVSILDANSICHEIIYVDDGSKDNTVLVIEDILKTSQNIKLICLSRNFGHQAAVTAGLDFCTGDATVIIDADLQDPPELIPEMIQLWQQGYDVIYGLRIDRQGESFFKKFTAKLFYRIINLLSEVKIPLDTGDFRLIDRCVVQALQQMPERDRFLRGLVSWVGFKQVALPYSRQARFAGESKYPFLKMIRFAADGILSFSLVPLRLAIWLGSISVVLALAGIIYAFVIRLMTSDWVPGWTMLFITLLFFTGIQLIILGIIGEYVGRIYFESKRRPLYLTRKLCGFESSLEDGKNT